MRRSFGGGSQRMGGGGILRSAVRAGGAAAIQESFSSSTNNIRKLTKSSHTDNNNNNNNNNPNTILTLSSSNSSPFTRTTNTRTTLHETDWEYVCGLEDKRVSNYTNHFDDFVFGTVPSVDEVQHALSSIQKVGLNSDEEEDPFCGFTDLDWIEPAFCSSTSLRHSGIDRVGGVLDLLRADPSVQKMVVSISSDEAIWKAVLNNEAVREFRDSINEDADTNVSSADNSNAAKEIANWVVNQIQEKVNQLVEKIMVVFHDVFQSSDQKKEGKVFPFEGKLSTSFFLSLVVMLMVVITRAHGA